MNSYLGLFLCLLSVGCSVASPSSLGSRRAILREVNDNGRSGGDHPDYAVELNVTNFDAVLKDTPATYAVVEFFAHWCPACRNYKPHYEKVARLFNGPNAVHPGIVLMTRVDCALKINTKLCDKFSVGHYPMLFWGPPTKFVGSGWEPKQEKSDIHVIDDARTADRLLNWINKQVGSSFGLDDQKFENEHLPSNVSDPGQIARAIYDVEEATSTAFDIILEHKSFIMDRKASDSGAPAAAAAGAKNNNNNNNNTQKPKENVKSGDKVMKAPGGDGSEISRKEFEEKPQAYFAELHAQHKEEKKKENEKEKN